MDMENDKLKWSIGWDYLFEEIWSNLDRIREDNLNRKYDFNNIDFCFKYLYGILVKEFIPKVKVSDCSDQDKKDVLKKSREIIALYKEVASYPEKMITINVTEQFLRAIY